MTQQEQAAPDAPAGAETKYLLVVGGLLVIIIILLAGLWLRERRTTRRLRQELAGLRTNTSKRAQLGAALRQMLNGPGPSAASRPLQRDDLPAETVTWNGGPRKVLRVGSAAGGRLGLLPGDVIVVAQPPATAPAE